MFDSVYNEEELSQIIITAVSSGDYREMKFIKNYQNILNHFTFDYLEAKTEKIVKLSAIELAIQYDLLQEELGGNIEIHHLHKLLKDGEANINFCDNNGNSLLHRLALQACHHNNIPPIAKIKILLEHGADVNLPNNNEQTPLDIIANNGYKNLEIVRNLVMYGAKIKEENIEQAEGLPPTKNSIINPLLLPHFLSIYYKPTSLSSKTLTKQMLNPLKLSNNINEKTKYFIDNLSLLIAKACLTSEIFITKYFTSYPEYNKIKDLIKTHEHVKPASLVLKIWLLLKEIIDNLLEIELELPKGSKAAILFDFIRADLTNIESENN